MKKTEYFTKEAIMGHRPDWIKRLTSTIFWITSSAAIIANTISSIDPEFKKQILEWTIAINMIVNAGSHGSGEVQK